MWCGNSALFLVSSDEYHDAADQEHYAGDDTDIETWASCDDLSHVILLNDIFVYDDDQYHPDGIQDRHDEHTDLKSEEEEQQAQNDIDQVRPAGRNFDQ